MGSAEANVGGVADEADPGEAGGDELGRAVMASVVVGDGDGQVEGVAGLGHGGEAGHERPGRAVADDGNGEVWHGTCGTV